MKKGIQCCSFEENGKFWFCSDNRKNIRDEKIQK